MSKKFSLPLVVTATTIVALVATVVYLSTSVNNLEVNLETTQKDLKVKAEEVIDLTQRNDELESEIKVLRDSVNILNEEIEVLKVKIARKENKIKELDSRIRRRETTISNLKEKIAKLAQAEKVNWEKIKRLEAEKADLKKRIAQDRTVKEETKTEIQTVKKEKIQTEKKKTHKNEMALLRDLVGNTQVRFNNISLRKQRHTGDLTKIKSKDKNWKYTQIEFFLEHPQQELLLGKTFRVKIKDLDNKRTLPLNEYNKKYPESSIGMEGKKFTYDGNMIEVSYFNSQKKSSLNYQIQVFLIDGDKAYVLRNGKKTIVEGGNVLAVAN